MPRKLLPSLECSLCTHIRKPNLDGQESGNMTVYLKSLIQCNIVATTNLIFWRKLSFKSLEEAVKSNKLQQNLDLTRILKHLRFFFLISLSLGETLLLEPFDGKVYDLLPVFLPELLSCPSSHLCLSPIFWLVFLSLSFRLS